MTADSSQEAITNDLESEPFYIELKRNARKSESHMRDLIIKLMMNGHTWTNEALRKHIKRMTELSPADNQRANPDSDNQKWEGIVNNALSGSLFKQGFVERVARGNYRITDCGRNAFEKQRAFFASMPPIDF